MHVAFHSFTSTLEGIILPEKFTFPFYYEPHPISEIAAKELQVYLTQQNDWIHNFGLNPEKDKGMIIGKMFGVLVVKNRKGELGWIAAFSGKLADENHHSFFVPPVFDILQKDGFFKVGEEELNALNKEIEAREKSKQYAFLKQESEAAASTFQEALAQEKQKLKNEKEKRDAFRFHVLPQLSDEEKVVEEERLRQESVGQQLAFKRIKKALQETKEAAEKAFFDFIEPLKKERAEKSARLQKEIFEKYTFLNRFHQERSLLSIFKETVFQTPPAGAGECAAPKLLQFAFLHQLEPICMAEFWWGQSPVSEIRVHGNYYPACRGKCEPILSHMLQGISLDENPMQAQATVDELELIFEDEHLVVVNKPAEFLSVPGKELKDSVYERMRQRYPNADGPLMVHRLDMSTSGILLVAKTFSVYKHLQRQFIQHTVKKRYVALLNGNVEKENGTIDLPLRLDIDDRPRQVVCFEHGKSALTHFEVIERTEGKTRVYFYPQTGRTHQLRVHAAHVLGLQAPIVGDDLYGTKANRLHLHAEQIAFVHPVTKQEMTLNCPVGF